MDENVKEVRPQNITCSRCGAPVVVGRRGPVPGLCPVCRSSKLRYGLRETRAGMLEMMVFRVRQLEEMLTLAQAENDELRFRVHELELEARERAA